MSVPWCGISSQVPVNRPDERVSVPNPNGKCNGNPAVDTFGKREVLSARRVDVYIVTLVSRAS